ncbi:lactonase family protein [Natrarchaeobius chitinivorans]|uniref:Lactonase family protein n=1 Tax=Natrarchaeobius chitinivorans TaxID=1679083 RepID=A0A3N6MB40_NATCH|nr:lactonase family protein [Natrarchaeobius chitinivorans]RQG93620.1 lactonase family protein [Natrarchaeobius chitinivorans]
MTNDHAYVGTYTDEAGEGIYHCRVDESTGELSEPQLAAPTQNPSFLATHPHLDVLYAVNETDDGSVTAFAIADDGGLEPLDERSIGPAGPCHCSVDSTGQYLLVAHYSGGAVSVLALADDGRIGAPTVVEHEGSSVHPDRQTAPHPHSIVPGPNDEFVYVADLGTDEVVVYALNREEDALERRDVVSIHDGAGPRHVTFDAERERAYLINELDSTLSVFDWSADSGGLSHVDTVETLEGPIETENYPAAICLHPSTDYVYGSNRGHDSVAVLDCSGRDLELVETVSTGGEWPRSMTLSSGGKYLIVANEHSETIVPFAVGDDGGLEELEGRVSVPHPVCVEIPGRP